MSKTKSNLPSIICDYVPLYEYRGEVSFYTDFGKNNDIKKRFPHTVSDIDTKSTYSFSPMYPVKDGTCTPFLTGILRSLTLRNLSFCPADSMKNPEKNLFNIPSNPLCPPRSL